ncbi:hypothetical protein [Caproiciproducens sp. CPB-2]|uniref:hypothetical protein n=1 Tax=Caproiciproducens sp. CPB-2 TaxID=3030017 RepID=UPI0023D99DF2|nr:hypothetical protein [Caproiciproducens sp. CPB-2]MDF1496311.1 hypothetical protein [Caproiciproducens sp. CPB-2]
MQTGYSLDQVLKIAAYNSNMDYNQLMIKVYDPILEADRNNLRYPKFTKYKKYGGQQNENG